MYNFILDIKHMPAVSSANYLNIQHRSMGWTAKNAQRYSITQEGTQGSI